MKIHIDYGDTEQRVLETLRNGNSPDEAPLCPKCGKYPVATIKGRTIKLCIFCAGENLNRAFTRFKCVVCGKLTAGCVPVNLRNHRERGDGTFRYPRRHRGPDGKPCPGNGQEAEWVEFIPQKDSDA